MDKPKIFAHGSYIGNTGYNHHTRDFFRYLSKYVKLKFRNFTIGNSWQGYNLTPHNNEPYLNNIDKEILYEQILWDNKEQNKRSNYKIYPHKSKEFDQDLNIILCETNHHIFYDEYNGPKIAYNVWESTLQPEFYFNKLLEFDELWVPSKWQRECTIKQGYDPNKIKVVPEGVDSNTFYPDTEVSHELTKDKFTFFLAGRWDYRKSTKEIIETFIKIFDKDESVELIVSIDNPFSNDGLNSTEERLKYYGLEHNRIKILHFPPREEYIRLLKSCNVFVSCARAEGWNLPLIESMACGTPSIYSNCSGQLEFAQGKGIPVKISYELPVSASTYNHFNEINVGNYYEPDFNDLGEKMMQIYSDYKKYKTCALAESDQIRKEFNWERIAEIGLERINDFLKRKHLITKKISENKEIIVSYVDGPYVEIKENGNFLYNVQFINKNNNKVEFEIDLKSNHWAKSSKKYYINWLIKITGIDNDFYYEDNLNLENKKVYVALDSKSLGDSLAWIPYVEEFGKVHNCKMVVSTFMNEMFENQYPNIEFIKPNTNVENLYAMYCIGLFYNDDNTINFYKNPIEPKEQTLQKICSDILGLPYKEIKPKLKQKIANIDKNYKQVCIGVFGTAQSKFWNNPNGWQEVVDWLISKGYVVKLLSKEGDNYMGNKLPTGVIQHPNGPLELVMDEMKKSKAFIGIGSGLSWLSWALNVPTVLISGFSYKWAEMEDCIRIGAPKGKCEGCFNRIKLDAGDWNWCPDHKGTDRHFECTKSITSEMVIKELEKFL